MKRFIFYLVLLNIWSPMLVMAGQDILVTNGNNSGEGSLRAALASGATRIVIQDSVPSIIITGTLQYTGLSALTIAGSGQIIDATGLHDDVLVIKKGADLTISNLSLQGPGGYSFKKQGGGKGIFIDVPGDRDGVVHLVLDNVTVKSTGGHGIHVSDCDIKDKCGRGSSGAGYGSPASIDIRLKNVYINGAGHGKADADGVRVDERGDGDIFFSVSNSTFVNVGADGVELDEGNDGSVIIDIRNSSFNDNGAYCLGANPLPVEDPCNDDGKPDVDDGFDIDEAGPGSITGKLHNLTVSGNFDEGLDFDEEGAGEIELKISRVIVSDNEDEGIKISEEDDGSVVVSMNDVQAMNNNGKKEDIEIEEDHRGDIAVSVTTSTIDKLKITEGGEGAGILKTRDSSFKEATALINIKLN